MPELPEVENVARALDKLIKNRTIESAELRRKRLAPDCPPNKFARLLCGAKINFVHRRGKHVLFDLDTGKTLITHLRMSGCFMLFPLERDDPKFAHAVFYLDGGEKLIFQDQRHFGLMKIVETEKLYQAKELAKLAPEPFSEDFSTVYFHATLKRSKRSLKEFLLDQTKVCGLGNIYASEAMFLANVSPKKYAFRLSNPKASVLHEKIREVLSEAVDLISVLQINPENIGGSIYGSNESAWRVYDRENEPCQKCKTPITRLVQAGRSTYYCRQCQK